MTGQGMVQGLPRPPPGGSSSSITPTGFVNSGLLAGGRLDPRTGVELSQTPLDGRHCPRAGYYRRRWLPQDLSGSYWRSQPPNQVCVTSSSHVSRNEALLRSHHSQAGRQDRCVPEESPSASSRAAGRPPAPQAGETSAQTQRLLPAGVALWLAQRRTTGGAGFIPQVPPHQGAGRTSPPPEAPSSPGGFQASPGLWLSRCGPRLPPALYVASLPASQMSAWAAR